MLLGWSNVQPILPTTSGACSATAIPARDAGSADRPRQRARATPARPPNRDAWDRAGKRSRRWARRFAECRRCRLLHCSPARCVNSAICWSHSPGAFQPLLPPTSRLGWMSTALAVGAGRVGGMRTPMVPAAMSATPAMPQGRRPEQRSSNRPPAMRALTATSTKLMP